MVTELRIIKPEVLICGNCKFSFERFGGMFNIFCQRCQDAVNQLLLKHKIEDLETLDGVLRERDRCLGIIDAEISYLLKEAGPMLGNGSGYLTDSEIVRSQCFVLRDVQKLIKGETLEWRNQEASPAKEEVKLTLEEIADPRTAIYEDKTTGCYVALAYRPESAEPRKLGECSMAVTEEARRYWEKHVWGAKEEA